MSENPYESRISLLRKKTGNEPAFAGNAATEHMKSLFVESAHFLPKPYSDEQLRDSMQGLLAA